MLNLKNWPLLCLLLHWSIFLPAQDMCKTVDLSSENFTEQTHQQEEQSGLSLVGAVKKLWPKNERVLHVRFVGIRNRILEQQIQKIVEDNWEQCCGIDFVFDNSSKAQITVNISSSQGNNSYVGTDSKGKNPSMNFLFYYYDKKSKKTKLRSDVLREIGGKKVIPYDSYTYGTILHEFGHAMGFKHEQQSPNFRVEWDEEKLFNYYKEIYPKKEDEVVRSMMSINMTKLKGSSFTRRVYGKVQQINSDSSNNQGYNTGPFQSEIVEVRFKPMHATTDFDPHSIMCYPINLHLVKDYSKYRLGILDGKHEEDLKGWRNTLEMRYDFRKEGLEIDKDAEIILYRNNDNIYIRTNIDDIRYILMPNSKSGNLDIYPWWGGRHTLSSVDRYFANKLYPYTRSSDNHRFVQRELYRAFEEILSRQPDINEIVECSNYMHDYGLLEMRYLIAKKATKKIKSFYLMYTGSEASDEFVEDSRQQLVERNMDDVVIKKLLKNVTIRSQEQFGEQQANIEKAVNIDVSTFQNAPGGEMMLKARRKITLKPGFHAKKGGKFLAEIHKE
ncbi:hypothetical protein UABAM_04551 [Candidatus Uabimicrobium amorphum]|uniref:Peptidase metallopeptidase domain-containing protein n=1 Tax=Uabimicrobium amorphum TaxID=2596890 RepID=A0A5S9F4V0_UABAM|nr:3-coathanger stack domain-containing protein [Candidatus Uabimicrobium amorphum]BBM86165.1 hypothetical protein UABAM_04551 [Candidatus Uabimicrobium amorphum]